MRAFFIYRLRLLFLLAGIKSTVLATTISSITCGKWTDLQTWNLGRIPTATDTIRIRHFVAFDTDFTSISPGLLQVDSSGTLCGPNVYKGHFLLYGPAYLGRLEIYYGRSHNYSSLKVGDQIRVYGNGAWEVHFPACVGCYPGCDSCTVTPTSLPIVEVRENPEVILPCAVSLPNLLLRNGLEVNRIFIPTCDSLLQITRLKVFNRWGKVVYDGDQTKPWWVGNDNSGTALADGTYFYQFSYQYLPTATITSLPVLTGWVELMGGR